MKQTSSKHIQNTRARRVLYVCFMSASSCERGISVPECLHSTHSAQSVTFHKFGPHCFLVVEALIVLHSFQSHSVEAAVDHRDLDGKFSAEIPRVRG